MRDIFISYVEEEGAFAAEIARGLEEAGYTTWYYQRDSEPGPSYLLQTSRVIKQAQAVVLIVSPDSIISHQVTKEVIRAHECDKPFVPLLANIKDAEFKKRQPEWEEALGSATSISVPPEGVSTILPRIIRGLKRMRIEPSSHTSGIILKSPTSRLKLADVTNEDQISSQDVLAAKAAQTASSPASEAESGSAPKTKSSPAPDVARVETPSAAQISDIPQATSKRKLYLIAAAVAVVAIGAIVAFRLISEGAKAGDSGSGDYGEVKLRTSEFSEHFTDLNRWTTHASGAYVKDEWLHLENQPSLSHPTGVHFGDFTMKFLFKLTNGWGAAWALRAKDAHNYYLFFLSGPEANPPGYFHAYIVRDDKLGLPVVNIPVPTQLKTDGEYRIQITAKGNVITHKINSMDDPSAEPDGDPLGVFADDDKHFPYGSVGFRTVGSEKFSVAELYVWPPEARKLP